MPEPLPKFDKPPVAETVMGVQFAPLVGYSTALAGWFWKSYLPPLSDGLKWEKVVDAIRVDDAHEYFGEKQKWGRAGIRFGPADAPNRVQIIQEGDQRLVQVQDTRFMLNWRRKDGPYPTYNKLAQDFWKLLPSFEKFAQDSGLGEIVQNQWEITYVNRIPKGQLWHEASEIGKIIPRLSLPTSVVAEPSPEPVSIDWRYDLPNERGRLYVGILHGRTSPELATEEFLQINLIARGWVDREKGWDLKSGFDLGHEAIVRTFASMTSSEAHLLWNRRQ